MGPNVSRAVEELADEIELVYHERYAGFRHAVAAVLGDYEEAHDAVQDGFAQALVRRGDFRGGSLEAWVWKIVLRKALDARRRRREIDLDGDFDPGLVVSERDPELAAAIRTLPQRRRLVVFLRYFADLSYDQISDLCGISAGTVAATLSQAHHELREKLELKEVER